MVRFYVRGEAAKLAQHEHVVNEIKRMEVDEKMIRDQIAGNDEHPLFLFYNL